MVRIANDVVAVGFVGPAVDRHKRAEPPRDLAQGLDAPRAAARQTDPDPHGAQAHLHEGDSVAGDDGVTRDDV